jgi:hypothetical protein
MRAALRAIGAACLTRNGLQLIALVASVAGSATLTALLWYAMTVLDGAKQWSAIANIAYGLLGTVSLVLLALGFVLGKRSFEAEFWKVKFKATTEEEP